MGILWTHYEDLCWSAGVKENFEGRVSRLDYHHLFLVVFLWNNYLDAMARKKKIIPSWVRKLHVVAFFLLIIHDISCDVVEPADLDSARWRDQFPSLSLCCYVCEFNHAVGICFQSLVLNLWKSSWMLMNWCILFTMIDVPLHLIWQINKSFIWQGIGK